MKMVKVEESYQTANIDEKNQKVLGSLRKNLEENISQALTQIDALKSSVSLYRDSLKDYCDLAVEKADLIAKYSKADTGGTYNLPGVFATSSASYNLSQMKQDNQRSEEVKNMCDNAENQKELYFKMIIRAQNELQLDLRTIARLGNDIDAYLEQLAQVTSWAENTINAKK
jgi:hypothetical protein